VEGVPGEASRQNWKWRQGLDSLRQPSVISNKNTHALATFSA
jgi:hypothetical protein